MGSLAPWAAAVGFGHFGLGLRVWAEGSGFRMGGWGCKVQGSRPQALTADRPSGLGSCGEGHGPVSRLLLKQYRIVTAETIALQAKPTGSTNGRNKGSS